MITLLLETSGKQGFVALGEGGEILGLKALDEGRRHARDLVPMVGELLGERGFATRDVGVVAVSQGPGSYTGLRVGIASALAFRFATGCHMMLVPTFGILAKSVVGNFPNIGLPLGPGSGDFEVLGDGLKGWVYHQKFSDSGFPAGELGISLVEDWRRMTPVDIPVVLAPGANLDPLLDKMGQVGKRAMGVNHPHAFQSIVEERISRSDWNDSDTAEPLYLRPSSAELQMIERTRGRE